MGGNPELGEGDPALNLYQMVLPLADVLADSGEAVVARLMAEIRGSRPWRVGSDSDSAQVPTQFVESGDRHVDESGDRRGGIVGSKACNEGHLTRG